MVDVYMHTQMHADVVPVAPEGCCWLMSSQRKIKMASDTVLSTVPTTTCWIKLLHLIGAPYSERTVSGASAGHDRWALCLHHWCAVFKHTLKLCVCLVSNFECEGADHIIIAILFVHCAVYIYPDTSLKKKKKKKANYWMNECVDVCLQTQ